LTFNYLVSLFNTRPGQQPPPSPSLFNQSLDRQFGWLGLGAFGLGVIVAVASVVMGVSGWEVERIWLYLLGSALFLLTGVQLIIYWILMRVLEELSRREETVEREKLKSEQAAMSEQALPAVGH
jgi:hypothetical protein